MEGTGRLSFGMKIKLCIALALLMACTNCIAAVGEGYRYPAEDERHEGTWIIWPHYHIVRSKIFNDMVGSNVFGESVDTDFIWVEMTKALHTGEIVHILAYDEDERKYVMERLEREDIDMERIDIFVCPTNDIWARDTGPIFILDENGQPVIADFKFDAWGGKQECAFDDAVPQAVADAYDISIIQIPELVLEGGSVECDGAGTLMAAKSSVVSAARNPDKTLEEVEAILSKYLGVTNFIWIEGSVGEDITDAHIDGTARFINDRQIFICSKEEYKQLYKNDPDESDWAVFENARNAKGEPYELVHLPLTKSTVVSFGIDMKFYGSYINYYIGNDVVLVPQYNDENDAVALGIIAAQYPDRETRGIDCSQLVFFGGMIHCITQQQPLPAAR